MITKDELERLKQPPDKNHELHYTIGGTIEAEAHTKIHRERLQKAAQGERVLGEAASRFREQMKEKSGSNFPHERESSGKTKIPPEDKALTEETWLSNHLDIHVQKFRRAQQKLRSAVTDSFRDQVRHSERGDLSR